MTNNDIYNLLNFLIRKDAKGKPVVVDNMTRLLQQANMELFKEEFSKYQVNQDISDSLAPFEVQVDVSTLTVSTTKITLPTNYAHFIGMYWTDSDSYDRAFDLVTDDQWDMRCSSTLTIPTNSYPICKVVDDSIYVKPLFAIYDDWFLPSKDELNQMYINLYLEGVGGFNANLYWSSSENSSISVFYQNFTDGSQDVSNKSNSLYVRACRSFTDTIGAYSLRDVGPGGGLIFYINGTTYYEAAPSDQSTSQAWSNITSTLIGTTGTAIGNGQANTTAIINQSGHTDSAAKLCDDLIIY